MTIDRDGRVRGDMDAQWFSWRIQLDLIYGQRIFPMAAAMGKRVWWAVEYRPLAFWRCYKERVNVQFKAMGIRWERNPIFKKHRLWAAAGKRDKQGCLKWHNGVK